MKEFKAEFTGTKEKVLAFLNDKYKLIPRPLLPKKGDRWMMDNSKPVGNYEHQLSGIVDGNIVVFFMQCTDITFDPDVPDMPIVHLSLEGVRVTISA